VNRPGTNHGKVRARSHAKCRQCYQLAGRGSLDSFSSERFNLVEVAQIVIEIGLIDINTHLITLGGGCSNRAESR